LLDQSLIYTAVTRGVEQVVLVGYEKVALAAIKDPATATRRYTNRLIGEQAAARL
jgi:exodeoxyribonuclease V alpha subunit